MPSVSNVRFEEKTTSSLFSFNKKTQIILKITTSKTNYEATTNVLGSLKKDKKYLQSEAYAAFIKLLIHAHHNDDREEWPSPQTLEIIIGPSSTHLTISTPLKLETFISENGIPASQITTTDVTNFENSAQNIVPNNLLTSFITNMKETFLTEQHAKTPNTSSTSSPQPKSTAPVTLLAFAFQKTTVDAINALSKNITPEQLTTLHQYIACLYKYEKIETYPSEESIVISVPGNKETFCDQLPELADIETEFNALPVSKEKSDFIDAIEVEKQTRLKFKHLYQQKIEKEHEKSTIENTEKNEETLLKLNVEIAQLELDISKNILDTDLNKKTNARFDSLLDLSNLDEKKEQALKIKLRDIQKKQSALNDAKEKLKKFQTQASSIKNKPTKRLSKEKKHTNTTVPATPIEDDRTSSLSQLRNKIVSGLSKDKKLRQEAIDLLDPVIKSLSSKKAGYQVPTASLEKFANTLKSKEKWNIADKVLGFSACASIVLTLLIITGCPAIAPFFLHAFATILAGPVAATALWTGIGLTISGIFGGILASDRHIENTIAAQASNVEKFSSRALST